MEKRILLLRHAKAEPAGSGQADVDRPLAGRGQAAAPAMGDYMASVGWLPERVLCSAARRARETLEALWQGWPGQPPVQVENALYGASSGDLLDRLRRLPGEESWVLLVGHNPGIQQLALELAGGGDPETLAQLRTKFPTTALAVLEADVAAWATLSSGVADLTAFVRPRDLA